MKNSVITNTWTCDVCSAETVSEVNPYFEVKVLRGDLVRSEPCNLDICSTCMAQMELPALQTYIASLPPVP